MATLKEYREKKGIKQSAVANALHITRQTYAKYEANPRMMPIGIAEQACDFIGCDISEIFFGNTLSETEQSKHSSGCIHDSKSRLERVLEKRAREAHGVPAAH